MFNDDTPTTTRAIATFVCLVKWNDGAELWVWESEVGAEIINDPFKRKRTTQWSESWGVQICNIIFFATAAFREFLIILLAWFDPE